MSFLPVTTESSAVSDITTYVWKYITRLRGDLDISPALYRWVIAVAQWLRCCATNQKVVGSIPDGVIGIFH